MVFAALSIFRGGFSRAAAEQVAGASLRQLGDLAAKSLIRLDRARNRYTLHEMVRQYAADWLAGDPATARHRFVASTAFATAALPAPWGKSFSAPAKWMRLPHWK